MAKSCCFSSCSSDSAIIGWRLERWLNYVLRRVSVPNTWPEFAVEAVIAWEAGKDPARAHLAVANLTGAIRLLLGLGWPMIYFVFAFFGRHEAKVRFPFSTWRSGTTNDRRLPGIWRRSPPHHSTGSVATNDSTFQLSPFAFATHALH